MTQRLQSALATPRFLFPILSTFFSNQNSFLPSTREEELKLLLLLDWRQEFVTSTADSGYKKKLPNDVEHLCWSFSLDETYNICCPAYWSCADPCLQRHALGNVQGTSLHVGKTEVPCLQKYHPAPQGISGVWLCNQGKLSKCSWSHKPFFRVTNLWYLWHDKWYRHLFASLLCGHNNFMEAQRYSL